MEKNAEITTKQPLTHNNKIVQEVKFIKGT